jgi:hypothetical protein
LAFAATRGEDFFFLDRLAGGRVLLTGTLLSWGV